MAPKQKKVKKGKPPPIDKLLVPAIVVGAAMLAYQFLKGMSADLRRVNTLDELEMRDVLFGEGDSGKSYAVLCQDEESTAPISSVFSDAFNEGSAPAHFRLIDCNYVLPSSGKSIAERFKLDLKVRPTIFISGVGVEAPQQIPAKHLKTGDMLVKALRAKLEVRAAKIETTQDLRGKCLDKPMCGLLLKGAKKAPKYLKEAMQELLKEFPEVPFAAVDSSVLYVKNLEDMLPELKGEEPRFVVFKKVSGSTKAGGDRLITSMATLEPNTALSYGTMSNLVAGVVRNAVTPKKLPTLPQVKTRTKKLVQEEKAKRERKHDQQRRQKEKAEQSSSGSGSNENDGSPDGRRAERERRRAEHRAKNNVREKTPEEMAEMERKRRERMAAEAEKWNMAPEDAPPAGSDILEEDLGDFEEGGGGGNTIVTEEEEEDDHEVIDLD